MVPDGGAVCLTDAPLPMELREYRYIPLKMRAHMSVLRKWKNNWQGVKIEI